MDTKELTYAAKEFNLMLYTIIPIEYVEKIPEKTRKFFERIEAKEYNPDIDINKPINQQNLREKTKDLIAIIYRNYWCNEEQKSEIDKIFKANEEKYQVELEEKYCYGNLFKNKKKEPIEEEQEKIEENVQMVEYKKIKWYQKIFDKILSVFRKK